MLPIAGIHDFTTTPHPTNQHPVFDSTINKMGDAEIKASNWRLVEVGRVVLIDGGSQDGKLAAIVEIIDHKRVRFAPTENCESPEENITNIPRF